MNMEENSEIKRKQNRLTTTTTTSTNTPNKKEKEDKADSKKISKKVGKVEEKGNSEAAVPENGQGHDEGPPPLKKPKRKLRKPTAEEDIIDGFAILAFKNYEELSRAIKLGENSDSRLCVQLLRRAEDGSVFKTVKDKKGSPKAKNSSPKIKSPKPKSTTSNKKKETPEKMANKLPGSGSGSEKKKRKSESAVGNSKKKQRANNGPTTAGSKEKLNNMTLDTASEGSERVSDGCTDLFATTRKDSSPYLLDNLHSPHEPKGLDPQEVHINHDDEDKDVRSISPLQTGKISPTSSSSTCSAPPPVTFVESKSKTPPQVLETSLSKTHTNGPLSNSDSSGSEARDVNGHTQNPIPETQERLSPIQPKTIQQTLFTPYATSAITRVSTPIGITSGSTVPDIPTQDQQSSKTLHSIQANSSGQTNNSSIVQQAPLSDFTLSGSHIHRSSLPHYDKTGTGTGSNLLTSSLFQRASTTPASKDTSCVPISKSSASAAFGSIARLLDSPNPATSSSRISPITISASTTSHSTNDNNSLNQFYLTGTGGHSSSAPQSCSSRSISPRSHSPPRERDSYSSNVSSLSRTSVTPVSGSSSLSQLPPNLSPLQSLSYSKAASWLSGVPPRLSPVPRPTPPPPILPPSSSGHLSSTGVSSLSGATPSPLSVFPGLVSGHTPPSPHGVQPSVPISGSAMFASPMLPLSSIMSHPSTQQVPFGPSADSLFQGQAQSELVRRDLESRFLGPERGGGPSQFLSRAGELHPHHQHLLSHLSGVNPMTAHNQPGSNPLFPPPMFKDLKMDSPFYRNLGLPYPGFNGILPPPPNLNTPFTSPSQLPSLTPKKTGKWNAMHVRIAWEIYQHQQKGGNSEKSSSNALGTNVSQKNPNQAPPTTSHSSSDLLRPPPPNHLFSGMNRPPDIGPPPFVSVSPLLSPHQTPHRGQFDPSQHALFLHASQHLGPSLARYPGFGALGPTFGGLSGLGSSLGRDLASLTSMSTQEQWQRMQRGALFPGGAGQGWPIHRPEREVKTPTESRRHKDERGEKRYEADRHAESKGNNRGDASPFRDRSRSPVRPSRTPLENGDTDSRSSRSNDSHSTTVHSSKSRYKEDSNGDREKSNTPQHLAERERDKTSHAGLLNDMKSLNYMACNHPSRLFHPGSPMAPLTSGWESFPGFSPTGPRMSSVDSFRLSLLQLNERDKEYSARLQSTLLRPHYPNGPFMNMPLGGLGQLASHPQPPGGSSGSGSNGSSSNSSTKNSPLGGPNPLLNHPSNSLSHQQQLTLHHSSSQNGCGSPIAKGEDNRGKD